MLYLQSLIPFPVKINENGLEGELDFRYNREDNYMVISFKYSNKNHDPAPVIVYIDVFGNRYCYVLFIIDQYNKQVKTALFKPEYKIKNGDGIQLRSIRPFVYRNGKY